MMIFGGGFDIVFFFSKLRQFAEERRERESEKEREKEGDREKKERERDTQREEEREIYIQRERLSVQSSHVSPPWY